MVKKLFKHEILAYLRVWIPIQIILLGVSALGRIIQFFESETTIYNTIFGSMIFVYVVTVIVSLGFTFFFAITRFYKNLFTGEGYLSFTLPVTTKQHIMTKLWTAVLFFVMSIFTVLLSVCIITAGDVLAEIIKLIGYFFNNEISSEFMPHLAIYIAEIISLCFVVVISSLLLFYACISIGQTFNKNRILASIGVYFGYYFISQVINTVFVIMAMILERSGFFIYLINHLPYQPFSPVHLFFCLLILYNAFLGFIYYIITKKVITKRLNLE